MSHIQEKQIAQARQNGTSAVSVYSPAVKTTAIIRNVTLCNQTTASATFRIFLDDDGTTYDESTALFYDAPIAAKTTISIDTFWAMNNADGNLAYRTSVANAITITILGAEIT